MFKAHLSAFFAKVSPAVYHLRFCLSWNRDIFFLADHSQLTLAPAQTSVSTLPSNTQSYPSAHLTISPLPTTFLDTSTIPSSSFFLPLPLHLPASLRFYLLVWKCSLKTVVQFSWCRSPTVWSTFDSLQPSFSKKKKKKEKSRPLFFWWHKRADVSDRAQEGLILFPGQTSECPLAYFPLHQVWPTYLMLFSKRLCWWKKSLIQRTEGEWKRLLPSFLFLVVDN